jgi:hypothetical protein
MQRGTCFTVLGKHGGNVGHEIGNDLLELGIHGIMRLVCGMCVNLHSFKYFCLNQYLAQLFYWDGGISFYGIYGIESVRGF